MAHKMRVSVSSLIPKGGLRVSNPAPSVRRTGRAPSSIKSPAPPNGQPVGKTK